MNPVDEPTDSIERKQEGGDDSSALAGVARDLPPWRRAQELQQRAGLSGFTWPAIEPVLDKLDEEVGELRDECIASTADADRIEDELGDVLFVLVNLSRHARVDYERALRRANAKFERRFRAMEAFAASDGTVLDQLPLEAQEALWRRAKQAE